VLRGERSALGFAQASPDAMRLTDAQCVFQTGMTHWAGGANGLGLLFSLELLALALEVWRRKEDGSLRAATRSFDLPCFLNTLCTH
jgi:hypothetical protein